MNGQWLGTFDGGTIIVNIDERDLYYQGVAYVLESDKNIPSVAVFFRTSNKDVSFHFRTDSIQAIDPTLGFVSAWENVKPHFPSDATIYKYVDVEGSWDRDHLTLSWKTDSGLTGGCVLPRSGADKPSEIVPLNQDWGAYKGYVSSLNPRRYLFRGQNGTWRLRTSFHRSGRADLSRFLNEDIPTLHRHLSARTKHVFNLAIPDENGAFLNMVRHHGYPTPLLDWTYSPYVAAFFAYRKVSNEMAAAAGANDKVRIFVFDQRQWKDDMNQVLFLVTPGPHFSIGEFIAIENERMIPQQAASTVTNMDDIESYIRSKETEAKKYISAIDLPVRERRRVIHDLRYMGITAGSLFPGMDGACEELAERNFEV
jgi:FRG domain